MKLPAPQQINMTPARFSKIGELIYGPSWRGELAVALKVSQRTLYRWLDKTTAIPGDVQGALAVLCELRAAELSKMAAELKPGPAR